MAGTELLADDSEPALGLSDFFHLDVGGWVFSIPTMALARFRESVLWREVCCLTPTDGRRIFLDRDGFVFRHVHHFLLTSQLSSSYLVELDVMYEQTKALGLQSMTEAIEKLKDEEPQQRMQTKPDMSVTEKAAINYWKTRKCSSRLCELPLKSSLFPGNEDKAPLGLLHNPFLDVLQDVPYCFLPIDMLEKYPGLLTDDNLLWFAENFALIECGCQEFRFIGNFLHTGKFFLPEKFSKFDVLEAEIKSLEIPGLIQALCTEKKTLGYVHGSNPETTLFSSTRSAGSKGERKKATKPFYILALELLAKYPDSALGQLSIESSVDGNKLYITGTGILFLHVKNWMGTCRLPLTRSFLEIYALCTFLDKEDAVYQSMREAVRSYLKSRTRVDGKMLCDSWTADVRAFPKHHIVRVYVRSHWYATYLKTLLKYPELLANSRKACWITCGFSLLVNGDGEIFRHILNFLRLGSLHLPSEFIEWDILRQEVTEFQIPSLVKALYECKAYRLWVKERRCADHLEDPKLEVMSWFSSAGRLHVIENVQENITVSSKGLVPDNLEGESRSPAVNLSDFLHSNEGREVDETVEDCTDHTAESSTTISACYQCIPPAHGTFLASDRENTLEYYTGGEGCRGEMPQDGPTVKEVTQGVTPVYDSRSRHHEYSRLTQTVIQCSHPPLDDTTASNTEAPCLLIERGGLGDLGTIFWVQHRPLLATDGSSTTFEDSIIYMTEMDIPRCEGTAEDQFFLTLNMSHKEILYARQCHSFLIGLILDCIQQGNPKPSICNVMRLVSMCWAFQIPVRQFVNNLMVPKFYKRKKHTREALRCWLEFSLPYARRYGKCVNMMLQKGHHRSASCVTLRNLLY